MNTELQPDQILQSPFPTSNLELLPPAASNPVQDQDPKPVPPARKLSRNGKISRLPYLERDMVNRMLRDNVPHSKIAGALAEHGFTVTQRNISNWKTFGGYRDWCLEQERALETHLLQDNLTEFLRKTDASQLPEVGLQLAATQLSQFFLTPDAQRQLARNPDQYARAAAILCRVASQIHTLQKYRDDSARELGFKHNPEFIKRENLEEIELTRSIYSAARQGESIHDPSTPRRNYLPKT